MMSAGEQEGIQNFHDATKFYAHTSGPLLEQAQKWQRARGQKWSIRAWKNAEQDADQALELLGVNLDLEPSALADALLDRCAHLGYQVRFHPEPHPVLGCKMRALIDLVDRVLDIYLCAMGELAARLPQTPELILPMVLAHELFHVLKPKCREPELTAHLFAAKVCGSTVFPGFLDLPIDPSNEDRGKEREAFP